MISEWFLTVIVIIFGGGGMAALVNVLSQRRFMQAQSSDKQASALATLEPIMASWIDRLETRMEEAETELADAVRRLRICNAHMRAYHTALLENRIEIPDVPT